MPTPDKLDPNALEILTGRFEGGQIPNLTARVVRVFLASAGAGTYISVVFFIDDIIDIYLTLSICMRTGLDAFLQKLKM